MGEIEDYIYFCDRIKQFYKKFNMTEDDNYIKYCKLKDSNKREVFINEIVDFKRRKKIHSLINS